MGSLSLSLALSVHLSSGIFTHFAECGTCNGTLLRFNATEAAVPLGASRKTAVRSAGTPQGSPAPPASTCLPSEAAVVERTSGSGRRECSEEQTPPPPSRLVCAELQGRLKVTDAMTCHQDSLLGLPTSWTGGQENRR